LQNLGFGRISKTASQNAQRIWKYFQALEKRMAKKWAKDEDFAKVSANRTNNDCSPPLTVFMYTN